MTRQSMDSTIRIRDLQQKGRKCLRAGGDERLAALETDMVISELLQKDRLYLMLHPDEEVEAALASKMAQMLAQRREGKPMAYLLGHKEFMAYDFLVSEGVLIPRDDTEEVIRLTAEALEKRKENLCGIETCYSKETNYSAAQTCKGLEIGLGSGIISLMLLVKFESLQMIGVDINPVAIENTKKNIKHLEEQLEKEGKGPCSLHPRMQVVYSDLLAGLELLPGELDFVVSNPPYIETKVIETLERDVKDYEPHLALDGGADGLDFYRKILEASLPFIREGGFISFEIGYDQGPRMQELMQASGLEKIELRKDLAQMDRAIIGFKKKEQ